MNILMVLADQHHADLLGCAGHGQVKTPRLDAFAASGVRFTRAYTQNTICTPSRVSILSGQYCHNHGLYALSGPAPMGLNNLMRQCKANGYRTAAYGKLHLPNHPRNWLADDLDEFGDTYETPDGVIGVSEYFDYLKKLGLRDLEDSWHNIKNYPAGQSISLDAMPSKLPYEHTQEVWCARKAMQFIKQANGQPFCVQIALQRPHHPLIPNQRFWDLYDENLDLPPTFNQSPDHRPPHFQAMWHHLRKTSWSFGKAGESFEDGARRAWRGTLACVSQMDDVFGMLLDFLETQDLADDTIVIYGSDHGCYHTIHGIAEKAPGICSDAVCRVPLLWRAPGITRPGTVSDALVENVDMAPTLLSLCGLPPLDSEDGKDISSLLQGDTSSVRDVAVTENSWSKSIRWGSWRFVHYQPEMFPESGDVGELYNMDDDPNETRNLYADPAHQAVVQEGRRRLLEWLIRTTRVATSRLAESRRKPVPTDDDVSAHATGREIFPLGGDNRAPNSSLQDNGGGRNYL